MPRKLRIDFVSDVACPWCIIGLGGLEKALDSLTGEIEADITFHPFELNPDMPPGGENVLEHIATKYGMSPDQVRENRARIRDRAAEIDFTMNTSDSSRAYNTFDAHRLIAWAGEKGRQREMKRQLFTLYFTNQQDTGDREAAQGRAPTGQAAGKLVARASGRARDRHRLATGSTPGSVSNRRRWYGSRARPAYRQRG